ncbi:hypothetical protein EPUS_08081 [Endocarpon pusillum Z07020]|uniref:Uncharacterized protein n=1 Tax=Endocarpon pusillum (strain Z07020 / HMAS-L-300199) TaxID=1263415 RepID=U1GB43_ENDPU|nr:uncharacterized protein EPUS_08081 [Endocarpon pusillum Z07020]ERF68921.1 hypothetical protein EPUS_08081 [Endocarpon pusillum Z07020]
MVELTQTPLFPESSNKACSIPQTAKHVQYTKKEERDASELQITWNSVMDKGNYRRKSLYTHVAVLVLYWEDGDLDVHDEVKELVDIFQKLFNYSVDHGPLKGPYANTHINFLVAEFVHKHNGRGKLMIVYYAGHGRPGESHGSLELFGSAKHYFSHGDERLLIHSRKTTTRPSNDEVNKLIWNNTENFLKDACADVLQIFDCCHAGDLMFKRGSSRAFEYLAATRAGELTNEKKRFTTVDLGREIKDHQHFPEEQEPVLTDRDDNSDVGRIELYALSEQDATGSTGAEDSQFSAYDGRVLTLHFDFGSQPLKQNIQKLGERLNRGRLDQLGIERIRWGGMKETGFRRSVEAFRNLRPRDLTTAELHDIALTPISRASPFSREETTRCGEPALGSRSTESPGTDSPRLTAKRKPKDSTGREKKRRKG